jgi:hypothetical protein
MDWGMEKFYVPFKERRPMEKRYLVYLTWTRKPIVWWLPVDRSVLKNENLTVEKGEEVDLIVAYY